MTLVSVNFKLNGSWSFQKAKLETVKVNTRIKKVCVCMCVHTHVCVHVHVHVYVEAKDQLLVFLFRCYLPCFDTVFHWDLAVLS